MDNPQAELVCGPGGRGWPDAHDLMARHGDRGFADAMSWTLPTDFQIPESIRGYIGLIDTEVLQSIGIFLIFVTVIIVLRRVRNLRVCPETFLDPAKPSDHESD